jgi:leader peptidase (prepilin peptidase) / N-methyltransferase
MQTLITDPTAAMITVLVVGLCVGSFLNVVIHRLPKMMERDWQRECAELRGATPPAAEAYNLWHPRSACPACGHRITAAENIPVVSWLVLRAKCSACGKPISARYPVVELAAALLGAYAIWHFGPTWRGVAACALLWTLLVLALIDADTLLLPDSVTLPLLWGGLFANLFGVFVPIADAVIGAIAGYLALWAVYWLFRLLFRKEGMGYGDFKLLAALGAWLGWKMILPIVVLSSVAGAVIGLVLIAFQGRDKAKPLPFGPYLAAGGAIALFAGPTLVELWLH